MTSPNLEELILQIHSAALAENGWDVVVGDLSRAFKAAGAGLVRPAVRASIKPSATLHEFDAAAIKSYCEDWARHDVWYAGAIRNGRFGIGQVNLDSHLIDRREFHRSPFFNEFLKTINIDRMMGICLAGPDSDYGPLAMSFYRALGEEAFSTVEAGLLSRLAPHLTVAAQNYWSARSLRLLGDAYRHAVDALSSAVFGITTSGHATFMNAAGEELLRHRRWLQLTARVLSPANDLLETIALGKALNQLARGISFKIVVTERATGAQAMVCGAPLSRTEIENYPPSAVALVWVIPLVSNVDVAADLTILFGLTPAERRLAARLIAGDELRDAAASLKITTSTARTQLKAIFNKTGRRSQAAFLTLAARLASLRSPVG